jgi:O-acetyl-ADP-ribose deacetylase (regulator of RNase III)
MISYVEITLFDSPAQTLVNTVNTVGVMGKGIAATFKRLYPEMYRRYRTLCQEGKLDIGQLYVYRTHNKIVVNFPTKRHWRQPSRMEYVRSGLEKFVARYSDYGISSVSFPQLGCGHGELDWPSQVQPLMEQYLSNLPIPVYVHLYEKPAGFVPERLDQDFARQVRLQRQRPSADRVWTDLAALISQDGIQLSLFQTGQEMDQEHVILKTTDGEPLVIYREDIEELWNTLRIRGTLRPDDLPEWLRNGDTPRWLFALLARLEYVKPIQIRDARAGGPIPGLRYAPLAESLLVQEAEIIV